MHQRIVALAAMFALLITIWTIVTPTRQSNHQDLDTITHLVGVTNDPPDVEWSKIIFKYAQPLANIPEVVSTRKVANGYSVMIKNVGTTTLRHYASGRLDFRLHQEVWVSDSWKRANWQWCGSDKCVFDIEPGESLALRVTFWNPKERERMLAAFTEKGSKRSGLVVLAVEDELNR